MFEIYFEIMSHLYTSVLTRAPLTLKHYTELTGMWRRVT
jgi:hypothetical protein